MSTGQPPFQQGAGAVPERSTKKSNNRAVTDCGNNLTTVIVQTVCCAASATEQVLSGLLSSSLAQKLGWKSNPGDVVELLVKSLGLDFSKDGRIFTEMIVTLAWKTQRFISLKNNCISKHRVLTYSCPFSIYSTTNSTSKFLPNYFYICYFNFTAYFS